MFRCSGLDLVGDHLDLSYRTPTAWPALTPKGSIRSYAIDLGDEEAGPSVQLGLITPVADEALDWKHSIDPVHFHGSDQFRVISGGEWMLGGRSIPAGGYAFQEAGWVYQEHPPTGAALMALVMGDRRGASATLKLARDRDTIFAAGAEYGEPLLRGEPYPHPAGPGGIAAIATSVGPCDRGYRLGMLASLEPNADGPGVLTGVLGDEQVGPVVHLLKSEPEAMVLPPCSYATELFIAIVKGSCRIGTQTYLAGDLRIQRSGAALQELQAGPEGLEAVIVAADRRAASEMVQGHTAPKWLAQLDDVLSDLSPVPGGARAQRERATAAVQ